MRIFDIFKRGEGRSFITFEDLTAPYTDAGVQVSQDTAVNLPAIYRCVALNTETVASLPVDILVKRGDRRVKYTEPSWFQHPNPDQDWGQFLGQVQASLELDGNAFVLKVVTATGKLIDLRVLPPTSVSVSRVDSRIIYQIPRADGSSRTLGQNEVLHITGFTLPGALRGLSPISCAKQAIGVGFAAEQYGARFFGSGATLSGIIKVPGPMRPEDADRLKESFGRKHGGVSRSHAIGILPNGADWTPLTVKPEESQFLETRRYTDVQIASLFGVPAEYVTEAEGAKGYVTGIFARQYMWLQTGINPRLVRLERAFSSLLPRPAYFKFNRNAFLQMDPQERAAFYAAGLRDRWLVPNEVRGKEDMDPIEGGDKLLLSVQWHDAQEEPTQIGAEQ